MKQDWPNLTFKISRLFPLMAMLAFGCAAQKPAPTLQPVPEATDNYLVYALNTKKTFSEIWTLGTNSVVTTGPLQAKTKVTISRDGRVESANITKPSGNPEFDRSVQQTLDRVKTVQPFGAGATDEHRTFVIDFELKPRP